jgi:hypothetical protein
MYHRTLKERDHKEREVKDGLKNLIDKKVGKEDSLGEPIKVDNFITVPRQEFTSLAI